MSAREEILARVRAAVADVRTEPGARGPVPVLGVTSPGREATLELFADRVAAYEATVVRVGSSEIPAAVAGALRDRGCRSAVVPAGLDPRWTSAVDDDVRLLPEDEVTSDEALDTVDAIVTSAAVGIATTGTIVLDHRPGQGRRALTLVPDIHVCLVHADQVVHDVPDSVARLRPTGTQARPLTWISGPSATSDIELQRVEGVHGPRTLVVILVADDATGPGAPRPDP